MNRKKISRFDYAKVQYYFDITKKFVKILTRTPAGASLQLVPNSQFTILYPSYLSHPSHNSEFTIHNLPIP